jgi:adenylate cyclase
LLAARRRGDRIDLLSASPQERGLYIPTEANEVPVERKLVAILAADIEGYSRSMHADEETTLAVLTAHRAICDHLIQSYNGRVSGSAGDSIVAEFGSATDAVNCAVAIQQSVHHANKSLPAATQMSFRIGINVGDVIVREGDIYGNGVNVASRVEGLADSSGVCVTRTVRDQVRDLVKFEFEDLGEKHLKNISRPVRIFRVLFDSDRYLPSTSVEHRNELEVTSSKPVDAQSVEVELAFWDSVKDSDDPATFEAYLKKYPDGEFRSLAEIRIDKLRSVNTGP